MLFEDNYMMTSAVQLLRPGQACRAGPDHRHFLARAAPRRFSFHPAFGKTVVDNILLHHFNSDRLIVNAKHTGGFARRGTNASRKFREIVGRMQRAQGLAPAAFVHQVVPIGNYVIHRTTRMAKRHAAIHTAAGLFFELVGRELLIDLEPIVDAFENRAAFRRLARIFQKSCDFPHRAYLALSLLP